MEKFIIQKLFSLYKVNALFGVEVFLKYLGERGRWCLNLPPYEVIAPPYTLEHYFGTHDKLDSFDLQIISEMLKSGPRNLTVVAEKLGKPQQTVNYRVRRFDSEKLVGFKAVFDLTRLGLEHFGVLTKINLSKQLVTEELLTPLPFWRLLAVIDGLNGRGGYVRYSIPEKKKYELIKYLKYLKENSFIEEFDFYTLHQPIYPDINLNYYLKERTRIGGNVFNWLDLIMKIDEIEPFKIDEGKKELFKFNLKDLFFISRLELNAREKFVDIAEKMGRLFKEEPTNFLPWLSKRYKTYLEEKIIRKFHPYIFPYSAKQTLLLMVNFVFSNENFLLKFLNALKEVPYRTVCDKVKNENRLFFLIFLPVYDLSVFHDFIYQLAETGIIKAGNIYFGTHKKIWNNVLLYEIYKDGEWKISFEDLIKAAGKIEESKKYDFI